ncbi:kinase-like domain-containing protein [Rostrohypoxylon terebratum]|nr:kinase-like domain-containing protein [Rostrohypoxylon terebratum]
MDPPLFPAPFPGIPLASSVSVDSAPPSHKTSRPEITSRPHLLIPHREKKRVTNHLKDHFSYVPEWKYERIIGEGSGSIAYLIKSKHRSLGRHRRVVIKRGTSELGDEELRIEMAWLELVRGAEHICTMLACRDDKEIPQTSAIQTGLTFVKRIFAKQGNLRRRVRKVLRRSTLDDELQLRELAPWPVIVLEYMPHGDLKRMVERAKRYNIAVPNRLLWSIFLCLVRACIGMAYHQALPEGSQTRTETIPAGQNQHSLVHGSMNLSNIMIGNPFARFGEHTLGPVAKLIDLGMAATATDGQGVRYNLWDVSAIMMTLVTLDITWGVSPRTTYRGIQTNATPILGDAGKTRYPLVDDDLRDLLARCLAQNPLHRPGLRDMLAELELRITKSAENFPFNLRPGEEDVAVSRFISRCIYDADVLPDPEPRPDIESPFIVPGPPPPTILEFASDYESDPEPEHTITGRPGSFREAAERLRVRRKGKRRMSGSPIAAPEPVDERPRRRPGPRH